MLRRKGYSLIMWTVVFAAAIGGLAIFQVPLKRALQTKIKGTANFVFWNQWAESPESYLRDTTTRTKSAGSQQQHQEQRETHAGKIDVYIDSSSRTNSTSVSVGKDDEGFWNMFPVPLN